jgi:hypothetical protein
MTRRTRAWTVWKHVAQCAAEVEAHALLFWNRRIWRPALVAGLLTAVPLTITGVVPLFYTVS